MAMFGETKTKAVPETQARGIGHCSMLLRTLAAAVEIFCRVTRARCNLADGLSIEALEFVEAALYKGLPLWSAIGN